jgi:Domain of unknown function (DUF4249)
MKKLFYGLLLLSMAGCKEKYQLPFTSPVTGYLVVEGVINKGPGNTYIELSRTNKLSATQKQYETGASVNVEGNDNSTYQLQEISTGRYYAFLNLNNSRQYRLRIKTPAGKEYLSDFVEVKITPPIDSISWQEESKGVQLHINTHDPQNNTRYYQWDYDETWEFHSAYKPVLKFVTTIGPTGISSISIGYKYPNHGSDSTIFKCWRSASSNQLLLGSSAKLSQDRIYDPLLFITRGDRRISVLYSINVKQYALTKAGYEFLEKMKKNTEQNGSIFDPQPSQLKGNIHCVTDANEPVIGYVNIASVQEQRLFIDNTQIPTWNYREYCEEVKIKNVTDSILEAAGNGAIPTGPLAFNITDITYFGVSTINCIDCTLSGTNVKPVFWK